MLETIPNSKGDSQRVNKATQNFSGKNFQFLFFFGAYPTNLPNHGKESDHHS